MAIQIFVLWFILRITSAANDTYSVQLSTPSAVQAKEANVFCLAILTPAPEYDARVQISLSDLGSTGSFMMPTVLTFLRGELKAKNFSFTAGPNEGTFEISAVLVSGVKGTSAKSQISIVDYSGTIVANDVTEIAGFAVSAAVALGVLVGSTCGAIISLRQNKVPRSSGGSLLLLSNAQFIAIFASSLTDVDNAALTFRRFGQMLRWSAYIVPELIATDTVRGLPTDACKVASNLFKLVVGTLTLMGGVHLAIAVLSVVISYVWKVKLDGKISVAVALSQAWGLAAIGGAAVSATGCTAWIVIGVILLGFLGVLILAGGFYTLDSVSGKIPKVRFIKTLASARWAPLLYKKNKKVPPARSFLPVFHTLVSAQRGPMWFHAWLSILLRVVTGAILGAGLAAGGRGGMWAVLALVGVETILLVTLRPFKSTVRNLFEIFSAAARLGVVVGLIIGAKSSLSPVSGSAVSFISALVDIFICMGYIPVALVRARRSAARRRRENILNIPKNSKNNSNFSDDFENSNNLNFSENNLSGIELVAGTYLMSDSPIKDRDETDYELFTGPTSRFPLLSPPLGSGPTKFRRDHRPPPPLFYPKRNREDSMVEAAVGFYSNEKGIDEFGGGYKNPVDFPPPIKFSAENSTDGNFSDFQKLKSVGSTQISPAHRWSPKKIKNFEDLVVSSHPEKFDSEKLHFQPGSATPTISRPSTVYRDLGEREFDFRIVITPERGGEPKKRNEFRTPGTWRLSPNEYDTVWPNGRGLSPIYPMQLRTDTRPVSPPYLMNTSWRENDERHRNSNSNFQPRSTTPTWGKAESPRWENRNAHLSPSVISFSELKEARRRSPSPIRFIDPRDEINFVLT